MDLNHLARVPLRIEPPNALRGIMTPTLSPAFHGFRPPTLPYKPDQSSLRGGEG